MLGILFCSCKGGCGKTTVACSTALKLSKNSKVALFDADVDSPNVMEIMGIKDEGRTQVNEQGKLLPVKYNDNLSIFSMSTLVPAKKGISLNGQQIESYLRQCVVEVDWGVVDYFCVDMPAGSSTVFRVIKDMFQKNLLGIIIITQPSGPSISDSYRLVNLCQKFALPVLGLVENMSGLECDCCGEPLVCPRTGQEQFPFGRGDGKKIADEFSFRFFGFLPLSRSKFSHVANDRVINNIVEAVYG